MTKAAIFGIISIDNMNFQPTKTTVRYFFAVFFATAIFLCYPFPAHAQTVPLNAGLMNKIWYSKDSFFADENIRIYTSFQNQYEFDLVGKIQFYDNDDLISESDFGAISGRMVEKWADWKTSQGSHELKIKITDTKKSAPGLTPEPIELPKDAQITTDQREIESKPIKDKITNKLNENNKIIKNNSLDSIIPENIADKISFATAPINTGPVGQVVAVLEEKRGQAQTIVQAEGANSQPIFYKAVLGIKEKYPQLQKPLDSLPSVAQLKFQALSIITFILKTPWALALFGVATLSFLWKLTKIFA